MGRDKIKTLFITEDDKTAASLAQRLKPEGINVVVSPQRMLLETSVFIETGSDCIIIDDAASSWRDERSPVRKFASGADVPLFILLSDSGLELHSAVKIKNFCGFISASLSSSAIAQSILCVYRMFEQNKGNLLRDEELSITLEEVSEVNDALTEKIEYLEEDLSDIFSAVGQRCIGLWMYHRRSGKTAWSASVYDILGDPATLPASSNLFLEKVIDEDRVALSDFLESIRANSGVASIEIRIATEPKPKTIVITASSVFDDNGALLKMFGTVHDISCMKNKEKDLLIQEQLLRILVENMDEAVFILTVIPDASGKIVDYLITDANKGFEKHTGVPRSAVIGKRGVELDENAPPHLERIARAMTGRRVVYNEEMIAQLGRHLRSSIIPLGPDSCGIVFTDITNELNLAENLRSGEERYRVLFETLSDGVMYHDDLGKVISANPAAVRLLGFPHERIIGRTLSDPRWKAVTVDGFSVQEEDDPCLKALHSGKPVTDCVIGIFHDEMRDFRWINLSAIPVFREGESFPSHVYSYFEDITERKKAQQDLTESNRRYHELSELGLVGVILVDNETGKILEANEAMSSIYGFSHDELMMMRNVDLSAEENETRKLTLSRTEGSVTVPLRTHRRRNGELFPIEATCRFFYWKGRSVHVSAIRDITERKKSEDIIRKTVEEKDILLSELRHRVKNSLSIITSLVELERSRFKDDRFSEVLINLRNRVLSLSDLYDMLTRSDGVTEIRLDHYLQRLEQSLSRSYNLEGMGIVLVSTFEEVIVDVKRAISIGLIFNEAFTNAVLFAFPGSSRGTIRLSLSIEGSWCVIRVDDDGVGYDLKSAKSKGMGMKLIDLLSRQIKGEYDIKSFLGGGTSFQLSISL